MSLRGVSEGPKMMGKENSPKSPDEGETHGDLFLDCHLEPAGQPDHNG